MSQDERKIFQTLQTPEKRRLEKIRFDPLPCNFPRPKISLLPDQLSLSAPSAWLRNSQDPSAEHFRHFSRGRYALGAAYQLAGVGPAGSLLAPAYHCITMLDPAIALDAEIALYPMRADLSPDLAHLDALLATCQTPPRALLAAHFFGRLQDFGSLRQWCDAHRILLIEDCSHVLLTEHVRAAGAGSFGQLAVSSPYKFFPSADGGLLYANEKTRLATVSSHPASFPDELRGIKHTLEKLRSSIPPGAETSAIDTQLETLEAAALITSKDLITDYVRPSPLFALKHQKTASLRSSRLVAKVSSAEQLIRRRQANYRRLAEALTGLPNAGALYPELAETDVPYMFPLRIEQPEPHFHWLKQLGVPIWRWDEMALADCPIASDYRHHLLHLPCHQSLTERQLDWMIAAIKRTLVRPQQGTL